MGLWVKWFGKKRADESLRPPVSRRLKTYSAESGFVYQYKSLGSRPSDAGTEYVFEISGDRSHWLIASVFLRNDVLDRWEADEGRELTSSEKFGLAKTMLVWTLDKVEMPLGEGLEINVSVTELDLAAQYLRLSDKES